MIKITYKKIFKLNSLNVCMGFEELERIKETFSKLDLHPVYIEHEPVIASKDAARTRGFELKQGIKAIVMTNGNNDWVVVDIPANKKVDMKKVADEIGWPRGKIRMANPEEVMKKTGCEVGAVPPFGHKNKIKTLIDNEIYDNKESAFNIGVRTNSVKIPTNKMKIIFKEEGSTHGDFSKM